LALSQSNAIQRHQVSCDNLERACTDFFFFIYLLLVE
jgi:hypothetical protein